MIEYIKHIEEYSNHKHSSFSKLVPSDQWGNRQLAEAFLRKYWLAEQDYKKKWKPVQDMIFRRSKGLPDMVYCPGFEMIPLRGGCLFAEEDFLQLQHAMQEIGENHFAIIQCSQEFTEGEPMFRMKFPVNITWNELMSGNYISAVLFEMNYNDYFVYGESGTWGKYSANDYEYPLDIIGFKPELAPVFKEHFRQAKEEQEEIREWLPLKYKEIWSNEANAKNPR